MGSRIRFLDVAALARSERLAKTDTRKANKNNQTRGQPQKSMGLLLPELFSIFLNSRSFAALLLLQQNFKKVNRRACLFSDEKQELRLSLF